MLNRKRLTENFVKLGKMLLSKDDSEFDSLFNKFIEFRKSNDWDKISQIRDENMKKNKARLGMK